MSSKTTEKNGLAQDLIAASQEDVIASIRTFIAQSAKNRNTASGATNHLYELLGEWQYEDSLNLLPEAVAKFMSVVQKDEVLAPLKEAMGDSHYDDLIQFLLRVPSFCNWMNQDEAAKAALHLVTFEIGDVSDKYSPERFAAICSEYDLKTDFLKLRFPAAK